MCTAEQNSARHYSGLTAWCEKYMLPIFAFCAAKLQNSCHATLSLLRGGIHSRLNSLRAHVCELHSDTAHVNTHILLLSCHVLVLLAVWRAIIRFKILHTRTHVHTLGCCQSLAVSLPVHSSNQRWHTALAGPSGQLEDTQRFCRSIITAASLPHLQ